MDNLLIVVHELRWHLAAALVLAVILIWIDPKDSNDA